MTPLRFHGYGLRPWTGLTLLIQTICRICRYRPHLPSARSHIWDLRKEGEQTPLAQILNQQSRPYQAKTILRLRCLWHRSIRERKGWSPWLGMCPPAQRSKTARAVQDMLVEPAIRLLSAQVLACPRKSPCQTFVLVTLKS